MKDLCQDGSVDGTGAVSRALQKSSKLTRNILERCLSEQELNVLDAEHLFKAKGNDAQAIFKVADHMRYLANGELVSFVVNRNINFTNVCYMGCKFCGFAKRAEEQGAEWLTLEEIVGRASQAWDRGATEVCIQGGLHPKLPATFYRDILIAIKSAHPHMLIHAFSPFEIWYGASKRKMNYADFLQDLKECGLDSMPGTAAEILDLEVRRKLTKNKLSANAWIEIIRTAHKTGIPTSATIMYGHVDKPKHWAAHLDTLRQIQKETNGFTELVPLSFVHENSPLYLLNPETVRRGPTSDEVQKMHAVSRIMLNNVIHNIQVSWTKLGVRSARDMLGLGVNDLGGTLMNESISRSAGSKNGQEIMADEMVQLIRSAGKVPVQRNTIYKTIVTFDQKDPDSQEPLVARTNKHPLAFLDQESRHKIQKQIKDG